MKSVRLSNIIIMMVSLALVIFSLISLGLALKNIVTAPPRRLMAASEPAVPGPEADVFANDVAAADTAPHIVAREYNGKIGIFVGADAAYPQRVLDVYVSTLPEYDRSLLRSGLRLRDERELAEFIEDYSS